jgi:hypothetical protein
MTEELWIDKLTLKKRLEIVETGLVELVWQHILTPYMKHTDGKYYPLQFKREISFYREEPHPSLWMEDRLVRVKHYRLVDKTKEEIAEELKTTFIWFRQIDIDDAEYEGRINFPKKPQEETKITSFKDFCAKGGSMPKKNPAISEALQIYLKENPKKLNLPAEAIGRAFIKKYNGDSNSCRVKVDGKSWDVFSHDDCIFSRTEKGKEKSIKLGTLNRYISDIKKSNLQK